MNDANRIIDYNPLRYFWIAEYNDDTALSQFDPETGLENLFCDVDQDKLRRFGWHPFSFGLAYKIFVATGKIVVPTDNPVYTVELKKGDKLIAYRHNVIRYANIRNPKVKERETSYVLGIKGGEIRHISEEGKLLKKEIT